MYNAPYKKRGAKGGDQMKILVTGGAGFIASHIVDAHVRDGHDVVIVDNLSTGNKENLNPEAKFYCEDVCSPKLDGIIKTERPDIIDHHAAQIDVRRSIADPLTDCNINIVGLLKMMESARMHGVKKMIFASSGGAIYGEQNEFPATEVHETFPLNPYGVAKLACEKYLNFYLVQYGIPYIAFRYANIYGPRQSRKGEAGVVAIFVKKMLKGETPVINGDGKQTRDYVYVGDVAELNRRAASVDTTGLYNVGTGVETDVNDVFRMIRKDLGVKTEEKHGPAIKGEQLRSSLVSLNIEKVFGYKPRIKVAEGLNLTVEWFKKEGMGS